MLFPDIDTLAPTLPDFRDKNSQAYFDEFIEHARQFRITLGLFIHPGK
jgi:hypothetical protein